MPSVILIFPAIIVVIGIVIIAAYRKMARWMFQLTESYWRKYYLLFGVGLIIFGLVLFFAFTTIPSPR